jgi:hypothetical protein
MEFPLHPRSETEFMAEIDGRRMEFAFTLGEDGTATSLTGGQSGFSMTLPRIPLRPRVLRLAPPT